MSIPPLISLNDAAIRGGMTEIKIADNLAGLFAITHFFAKTKPEHETTLSIGHRIFARTNTYKRDPDTGLFEICFFSKIVNLIDLPTQYANCLCIQGSATDVRMHCEGIDSIYVKMLPHEPLMHIDKMSTYVELTMPAFGLLYNVWLYYGGMMVPRFEHAGDWREYAQTAPTFERLLEMHGEEIKKYVPDAIVLKARA